MLCMRSPRYVIFSDKYVLCSAIIFVKEFTDTVYVTFNVRGYAYGTVQATSEVEMSK